MIYNVSIDFLFCKGDFSVSLFTFNDYYVARTQKTNGWYSNGREETHSHSNLVNHTFCVAIIKRFSMLKMYLAKIVNGHISQASNPF